MIVKLEIVYTNKSKHVKQVAQDMARWAKTYAKPVQDFSHSQCVDLLVISFDSRVTKDKELIEFINSLNRNIVKNVSLVNAFYFNPKQLTKMIKLCQQADLPLMREQYSFKLNIKHLNQINPDIINGARLYIEDMINIVRNYY